MTDSLMLAAYRESRTQYLKALRIEILTRRIWNRAAPFADYWPTMTVRSREIDCAHLRGLLRLSR